MSDGYEIPMDTSFFFILLLLYVILGGLIEHKKVKFGHETGVALILGLMVSAGLHFSSKTLDIKFDGTIFFYVCLPPIIFASGFNMRRKKFFQNIGYVLIFGIFGTIVTFFAFTLLTFGAMQTKFIYMSVLDKVS